MISSVGIRTLITALGALGRRFESCRPDWVFIKGPKRFHQIFTKSLGNGAFFHPHDRPANRAELLLSVLIASASSVANRLCEIFSSRESSIRRKG